jgi:hypothetical protein
MKLRVVFDTNIYVSAAVTPNSYLDLWLEIASRPGSRFDLYVSPDILAEVRAVLTRKFGYTATEASSLSRHIRQVATVPHPTERLQVVKNDPDDNMILECALAANAHLIVTADSDLLNLNPFRGIGITHPRELRHIFAEDYEQAA